MIPKNYILFLLSLALSLSLSAQQRDLISSRHSSYYSYIYQITNKEARKLNKKSIGLVDYSYLHTIVDSLPPHHYLEDIGLKPGNYLEVTASENKLDIEYVNISDFTLQVIDNKKDLCVQLLSKKDCSPVTDAVLHIRNTRIPFDDKTLSYRLKTTDKSGFLTVSHGGVSSFYRINKEYEISSFKRTFNKILFYTGLGYIYRPVYNLIAFPVYAVKNLIIHESYNPAGRYFRNKTQRIVGKIFPGRYENDRNAHRNYTGYLVFSKPMYRPGDTVDLKAYIVGIRDGKPFNGKVNMYLEKQYDYYQNKQPPLFLGGLSPYAPGGYSSRFLIADSLHMTLDTQYEIRLKTEDFNEAELVRGAFKYCDYELKRNTLKVSIDKNHQWRGELFSIHVIAKDDNGNAVPDCHLELKLTTGMVQRYDRDKLFIPDLLLEKSIPLLNGYADIVIPDSIFPDVCLTYNINATLLSADNEKMKWDTTVIYDAHPEYLSINTVGDSIRFSCTSFGLNKEVSAEITGYDSEDDELFSRKVTLPYSEPINLLCSVYEVTAEGLASESLEMNDEKPELAFFGDPDNDSLFIVSANPRNIPFSWYLYNGNRLIERGFDRKLNYRCKNTGFDNYTLSFHYTWAGEEKSEIVSIAKQMNKLNIKVQQPATVYPGQSAEVNLTVTDSRGNPVPDVDLTCYGITHKFGNTSVSIPSFGNKSHGFQRYNSFRLRDIYEEDYFTYNQTLKLDYPAYRERFGLDTIEYYHFLYPGDSIYTFTCPANDEITQVAPFIVDNGEVQAIRVLYIDSQPYYFNWVDVKEPYSFEVSPGKHSFRFILIDKEITLTRVIECRIGYKTIFSFDEDMEAPYLRRVPRANTFSKNEIENLSKYVFPYRGVKIPENNAYLQQYHRIIPLPAGREKSYLAGPIDAELTRFRISGQLEHVFEPEPGFQYEFLTGVIKMRSMKPEQLVHSSFYISKNLNAQVYTPKRQSADDKAFINSIRRNFTIDPYARLRDGSCVLKAELNNRVSRELHPLNILLINCDSTSGNIFLTGENFSFNNLNPSRYCMMMLLENDSYFYSDTINVKPGGINFLRINIPKQFRTDSVGIKISETIIKSIYNNTFKNELNQQNYFRNLIDERNSYSGKGFICKGRIVDKNDGEPVPFACIIVKDTKYGTTSDIDGNFMLNIPDDCEAIEVSFVGYKPATVKVYPNVFCLVKLAPGSKELQAVEIVDYKVPLISREMTASSSIVMSQEIAKMPSRNVSSVTAVVAGVVTDGIRGSSHGQLAGGEVMYIDGIRVSGNANLIFGLSDYSDFDMTTFNSAGSPDRFHDQQMPAFFSSIRNRFNDCAYWQPALRTDKFGKASFKVKYPDDITRWDTYVLAMNGNKQSGIAMTPVLSYKPLIAQIFIPRFLVAGDTANVIGKTINYTSDTLPVKTSFELNGTRYGEHNSDCSQVVIDSMMITASHADTLKVKYQLTKSDGYFDGEIRDLPVKPFGVEESEGLFMMFDHDTTMILPQVPGGGSYQISADADYFGLLKSDISSLHYYPYLCNEQLASKLRGLLAERILCKYQGEKFKGDKDVNKIIAKLIRNQNKQHVWGWWDVSNTVPWISKHVITTLLDAREAGYVVNLNLPEIIDNLVYSITIPSTDKLEYLYILSRLKADVSYRDLISTIEKGMALSTSQKLLITEIKQAQSLPYSLDDVMKMSQRTIFGNYYWGNENQKFNLFENTIEATLRAYRILEKDSAGRHYLPRIRAYLLSQRKHNGWMNTYQCAGIIETLLPAMLENADRADKPVVEFSGPVSINVTEFPFTTEIKNTDPLKVTFRGNSTVYLSAFTKKWNPNPSPVDSLFRISTELIQGKKEVKTLKAGESATLKVKVVVKKPAEYVKLEVPVPAGCSYDEKSGWYPGEQYREQYRDRTVIFCNKLDYGSYTFEIKLQPRYTGSYSLLPAVAELMYFPIFFGRNEAERVRIGN